MASIIVRTAEKDNTQQGGTESKFYRTYELPTASVMQWGSQRNGRSGGQYKVTPGPSEAGTIYGKKLHDGYSRVDIWTIDIPDADLSNAMQSRAHDPKNIGAWLEQRYMAAVRSGAATNMGGTPSAAPKAPQPRTTTARGGYVPPSTPVEAAQTRAVDDVVQVIDAIAAEVLDTMGLAASDAHAAMVATVRLREDQAKIVAAVEKLASYLDTLDELVDENA